jgi:acetyl esterase/lipase
MMEEERELKIYNGIPYQRQNKAEEPPNNNNNEDKDKNKNKKLLKREDDKLVDVYVPTTATRENSWPIIVYCCGGGWKINEEKQGVHVCSEMARMGYVVVCVDYARTTYSNGVFSKLFLFLTFVLGALGLHATLQEKMLYMFLWMLLATIILIMLAERLPEEVKHPAHINDVAEAVAWIHQEKNAQFFHGNMEQICMVGHSAGAHLISLLCTNPIYLKRVGLSPLNITAAVALSGVFNNNNLKLGFLQNNILTETFGRSRDIQVDAFPINHLHPDLCPPFLLFNAEQDFILKRHAQEFYSELKANNIYVEMKLLQRSDHCNIIKQWNKNGCHRIVLFTIHAFLQKALKIRQDHPYISTESTKD